MDVIIPRHVCFPLLPFNKTAIAIYPFIFWSKQKKGWLDPGIVAHEMYHLTDQLNWKNHYPFGLTVWLTKYVALWFWYNLLLAKPAREHPMEAPAYERGESRFV